MPHGPPLASGHRQQVSLFTSHPLMLERMRLQLDRSRFEVHAYLLAGGSLAGIEPLPDGVWVIDGHEISLVQQVLTCLPVAAVATSARAAPAPPSSLQRPPVIVVAAELDDARAFSLLFLGVRGLIVYPRLGNELARAIEAVQSGAFWMPRLQMSRFVDCLLDRFPHPERIAPAVRLSARERQVLDALLARLSNKEIAGRLAISERTVKFHVSNLLRRFGVAGRHDLALQFLRLPGPGLSSVD